MFRVVLFLAFSAVLVRGDDSLVRAVAAGDIERVKLLLRSGANPNAGKLYQMPVIAFPLMMNNPEMFHALADAGADLRWVVVRALAVRSGSAVRGFGLPARASSVHFHCRYVLGGDGAGSTVN